jgi:hypothetical protein
MTKLHVLLIGLCVALGVTLACFFAALAPFDRGEGE